MAGQCHGLPRRLTDPRGLTAFHNYENPPTSKARSGVTLFLQLPVSRSSPPKTGKGGWEREKKIGHRVGMRRTTHPGAATANNVRTGRSPARLANFISLSGQALNFRASIIALVRALRALQRRSSSSCVTSSHPPPRVHTSRNDPQYHDAPLYHSLRQFDGFHFGSRATTIVSLPPCLRVASPRERNGEILHEKKKNTAMLVSVAIKVNPSVARLESSRFQIVLIVQASKRYVKHSIEHQKI